MCSEGQGLRGQEKPEKCTKEERQRARQTPLKDLVIPAKGEKLASSSENLSLLKNLVKWPYGAALKPGECP